MTKRMKTEPIEIFEPIEQAAAADQGPRVFDFTGLIPSDVTIYYLLRRVAILAGDENLLPDGKTYTEAEVKEILGEDYERVLAPDTKCCG